MKSLSKIDTTKNILRTLKSIGTIVAKIRKDDDDLGLWSADGRITLLMKLRAIPFRVSTSLKLTFPAPCDGRHVAKTLYRDV
jgi:hypothetical protein